MPEANLQCAAGWRGVIGYDFTFGRARALARAIARASRARGKRPKFLVAYDTRFFSAEFARAAASALEAEGAGALLADRPAPSAAVSLEILRRKLSGGIYITAGQARAETNGLRWIGADGAAASPTGTAEIETVAENFSTEEADAGACEEPEIERVDVSPPYLERLGELVRLDAIRRSGLKIACDAMHGAAAGWLDRALLAAGAPVHILNAERDVLFEGRAPDPAAENLGRLAEVLQEGGAALGLAAGGDGRRFGIVERESGYIPANSVAGLIYDYLIESRGWRVGIACRGAVSPLLEAVAHRHGQTVYQTPAGSGHFADMLAKGRVAAGVEEDGGLTIRGHVPESDGILAGLLVAEMVAERGPVAAQLKKLLRRVGAKV